MLRTGLFFIFLCVNQVVFAVEVLNYEGSSTVGKFISDAATVYDKAQFKLNTIPESSGGEQCAYRRKCDMGGVARDVNERFLNKGVVKTLIGKDAIAALVHADNPVEAVSSAQLRDIFSGKIRNWSAVGGQDAAIKVYVVKEASATRKVFANAILGDTPYGNVKVVTPDAKMLSTIARDPNAIGQLSFAFLGTRSRIKPLTIDGQTASVNNPDYPITRPLHIATHGKPTGAVKAFLDWTLSAEGQAVVKKRFVGVK